MRALPNGTPSDDRRRIAMCFSALSRTAIEILQGAFAVVTALPTTARFDATGRVTFFVLLAFCCADVIAAPPAFHSARSYTSGYQLTGFAGPGQLIVKDFTGDGIPDV